MKKILLFLIIPFSLAQGVIIERDVNESKIYIHPTPFLEVNFHDLDELGALVSYYIKYDQLAALNEIDEIKKDAPDFEIISVGAEAVEDTIRIEIPVIEVSHVFNLKQGEVGPYLNGQIYLSLDQLKKIRASGKSIRELIGTRLKLKSKVPRTTLLEHYQSGPEVCRQLESRTVGDLILAMTSLKRPKAMQYTETFMSLKRSILEQCFDVTPAEVPSFGALLKLAVERKTSPKPIEGKHVIRRNHEKEFIVELPVVLEVGRK